MPGATPSNQPFPAVPTVWGLQPWYQFAVGVQQWAQQFVIDLDPPSAIVNPQITETDTVTTLTWEPARKAAIYHIYRGTSGNFANASFIAALTASKTKVANYRWQDAQDLNTSRYYWIVPLNERGIAGPKSAMLTSEAVGSESATKALQYGVTNELFYFDTRGLAAAVNNGGGMIQYTAVFHAAAINAQTVTGIRAFNWATSGATTTGHAQIGSELHTASGGTLTLTWSFIVATYGPVLRVSPTSTSGAPSQDILMSYYIVNTSDKNITIL